MAHDDPLVAHREMKKPNITKNYLFRLSLILFFSALMWVVFILPGPRPKYTTPDSYIILVTTILFIVLIVIMISQRYDELWLLASEAAATFVALIALFSTLYLAYGTKGNFNIPLSRIDAIYFAMGTFSTAGTGNIVATSEGARAFQTAQMAVDLALVLIVVGILVARLSSSRSVSASDDSEKSTAA